MPPFFIRSPQVMLRGRTVGGPVSPTRVGPSAIGTTPRTVRVRGAAAPYKTSRKSLHLRPAGQTRWGHVWPDSEVNTENEKGGFLDFDRNHAGAGPPGVASSRMCVGSHEAGLKGKGHVRPNEKECPKQGRHTAAEGFASIRKPPISGNQVSAPVKTPPILTPEHPGKPPSKACIHFRVPANDLAVSEGNPAHAAGARPVSPIHLILAVRRPLFQELEDRGRRDPNLVRPMPDRIGRRPLSPHRRSRHQYCDNQDHRRYVETKCSQYGPFLPAQTGQVKDHRTQLRTKWGLLNAESVEACLKGFVSKIVGPDRFHLIKKVFVERRRGVDGPIGIHYLDAF